MSGLFRNNTGAFAVIKIMNIELYQFFANLIYLSIKYKGFTSKIW